LTGSVQRYAVALPPSPESYEVTKPISRFGWFVIDKVFGCPDRRSDLRAGMETTLSRVAALAAR